MSASDFTRRTVRTNDSPSMSCADGNVAPRSCSIMGVIESTPIRAAVDTPGIAASAPMRFMGFQLIGNRLLAV